MERSVIATGLELALDDLFVFEDGVLTSGSPIVLTALTRGLTADDIWHAPKTRLPLTLADACGLTLAYVWGFHRGWLGTPPGDIGDDARIGWRDGSKCYAHAAREVYESTWGVTDQKGGVA